MTEYVPPFCSNKDFIFISPVIKVFATIPCADCGLNFDDTSLFGITVGMRGFVPQGRFRPTCTHIVTDDSMHPTIPKGAQVKTMLVALESVKDGDFICFAKDDCEEIYIRQIELLGDNREKMLLKSFNSKGIKSELIEASSGRLYEKVVQLVINFE